MLINYYIPVFKIMSILSVFSFWHSCSRNSTTSKQSGNIVGLCMHFFWFKDRLAASKVPLQCRHSVELDRVRQHSADDDAALPNTDVVLFIVHSQHTKIQGVQKEIDNILNNRFEITSVGWQLIIGILVWDWCVKSGISWLNFLVSVYNVSPTDDVEI